MRRDDVDIDVGTTREPRWSLAALGLPLPQVGALLAVVVPMIVWIDARLSKIDTVIEQNKEIKADIYHQAEASRDLALRDQRIDQLERRVGNLEAYIDGRRR
jgi:hypothetical protein